MTWGCQNTEAEAHAQLSFARDCGVNFLDTAELYPIMPDSKTQGRTSEYIGNWLKAQPRDKVIVASKVAGRADGRMTWIPANRTSPPAPLSDGPRVDASNIKAAVEGELRRLNTDYIDLMQIHWPDRYVPKFGESQYCVESERTEASTTSFQEQVEAMGALIQQGKVRHWGLSNETSFGVMRFCSAADAQGVPRPITVQNHFSLLNRTFESELAETCAPAHCDLGLLPWSALSGGALSGKYLPGDDTNRSDQKYRFNMFPGRYQRFESARVNDAVREYSRIAESAGLTPAQLAYAYCRSRWFVPSTIVGATSLSQLRENMGAFTPAARLHPEVLAAIDAVHSYNRNPALSD